MIVYIHKCIYVYAYIYIHLYTFLYIYSGPWIENLFIDKFIKQPFTFFNGIIPLFVQWSDYHLNYRSKLAEKKNKDKHNSETEKTEMELFHLLCTKLRKNVIYMVISQANYGLEFLSQNHKNVIIFSAGGEGNIPIPLIKGVIIIH
jgi:hypothetical protein